MIIDEHKKLGIDKIKQDVLHISPKNNRKKFDRLKALMVASFSFYGKLFTKADGRKIKLEKSIFNDSKTLLKMHNELMELRHNYVAHSGEEKIEYVNIKLMLDAKRERNVPPLLVRTFNQPDTFNNEFLDEFLQVCKFLLEKVNRKIKLYESKFYKNLTPYYMDMYYKLSEKQN